MRVIFFFLTLSLLLSCNSKTEEQSIDYSKNFILENKNVLISLKKELYYGVDSIGKVISFTSQKPGSQILLSSCNECYSGLNMETQKKIAIKIDELNISYITIRSFSYCEYGFYFRNNKFNQFYIREYDTLSDTLKYVDTNSNQYHLIENWMLYSKQR